MQHRDRIILKKIILEINKGFIFLGDTTLEEFLSNEMLKYAIAMDIINIGELVKSLTPEFRSKNNQIAWKDIAGFRDIAAHKYEILRMNQVYNTVKKDFPELKIQIEKILEAEEKAE